MSVPQIRHGFLGKKDPVPSPFHFFRDYFDKAPGPPPGAAHYGYRVKVPWGMCANGPDPTVTIAPPGWGGCGDCVEAFKVHALMNANYDEAGHTDPIPRSDQDIEQYCVYQGCTPAELFANPNQYDNGEDMTTSLIGWAQGVEYGVKLGFTAPVDVSSQADLKNAIYLGGGLGIGVQLQQAQEQQFPNEWQWVAGSPIIGGHAVWVTGYDDAMVWLTSWGLNIPASWQWVMNAIDEAHVVIMPQAIAAGHSPTGLLIPAWEADLNALAA